MEIVINYLFVIVSLLGGGQTEVKHSAVGSRSLVVCNHQNKPEVLQLALKECNCGLAEQNPFDPCHCWGNFSKDDLPSVQGDPRIFIFYFLRPLCPQFDFVYDDDFAFGHDYCELSLYLPGPKKLSKLLKEMQLDEHFYFLLDHELASTDQFLQLLAQGKAPICGVKNQKIQGNSFLYQNYFHDIFNHFFIWLFMPEHIKNLIKERTKIIIEIDKNINVHLDKIQMPLWNLVKDVLVSDFDASIGILNNKLFNDRSLKDCLCKEKCFRHINFFRSEQEKNNIKLLLESAINFGWRFLDEGLEVYTHTNHRQFVIFLIGSLLKTVKNKKNIVGFSEREIEIAMVKIMEFTRQYLSNEDEECHFAQYTDVESFIGQVSERMKNIREQVQALRL